jgi:hypothetical protein
MASFLGQPLRGGAACATLLADDTLRSGGVWRLVVGNAAAALAVAMSGVVTCGCGTALAVTHVVNCAAAQEPYKYLNTRPATVYANVVTRDSPAPAAEDAAQHPDWGAALQVLDASRAVPPREPPVCVFVHCVYGLNRSVTTACLLLRAAYPAHFASFDAALSYVHTRHATQVMPVYALWARQALHALGLPERLQAGPGPYEVPAAAPPPAAPRSTRTGRGGTRGSARGASVLVLHDYADPATGAPLCLAALLVRDHTRGFTPPTESPHAGEAPPSTGARALAEELHVRGVSPATLADPSLFHAIDTGAVVVFITRLGAHAPHSPAIPGAAHSRAHFAAQRAAVEAASRAGARFVDGAALRDYLETTELAHARVEDMLAEAGGGGAARFVVRDQRGRPLDALRPMFVKHTLACPAVRRALQEELHAYAARHRPALLPQAAAPAAVFS